MSGTAEAAQQAPGADEFAKEKSLEDGSRSPSPGKTDAAVQKSPGFFSKAHFFGPIDKEHGDIPLLACSFVTGLIDASTFSNWVVFIGMQTGNTVILGLSTAGLPDNPHAFATTLVSIGSFLIGAFFCFRVSKFLTPNGPDSNRLCCSLLFAIQGCFILLAAIFASIHGLVPQNPGGTTRASLAPSWVVENVKIVSLIPLLGLQSGMQISASRLLGFNELPINVLTSTYCDLMGDFNLFKLHNLKRNRRCAAVVLVLCGAISSGWLMRSNGGLQSVFWVGGGIKVAAGLGVFFFFPAKKL